MKCLCCGYILVTKISVNMWLKCDGFGQLNKELFYFYRNR